MQRLMRRRSPDASGPHWFVVTVVCTGAVVPGARAQSDVAFPPEVYAERRARLVEETGVPVVVPGEYMIRGRATRQDPNFWYLSGVESPYGVLVILPGEADRTRDVLFVPRRFQFAGAQYSTDDPRFREASWNQPIRRLAPGSAGATAVGMDAVLPVDSLLPRMRELLTAFDSVGIVRRGESLYAPAGLPPPVSIRGQFERNLEAGLPDHRFFDVAPVVERMRLVKDQHEIAALRRAAEISVQGMLAAMAQIKPGRNDLEIAGVMEYVWKREGSPRPSFGAIVSSGSSAVSLYTLKAEAYNATDRVMRDGELVFIDYGAAEWRMYTSDICRTFPVNGRFSPRQRAYYEVVLEAQDSALAMIRPGAMMIEAIRAAARVFDREGWTANEDVEGLGPDHVWGLMPSPTYWIRQRGELTDYSGARGTGVRDLGHHIGLEALDSRDYAVPLQAGMVITVEPKIYVPDEGLAIMIEDMILVTADGYENLSAGAPRTVDEIERVMARRGR